MSNCNRQVFKTCIQLDYVIDRFNFCQKCNQLDKYNSQIIIFNSPFQIEVRALNVIVRSLCVFICLCICMLMCLCIYSLFFQNFCIYILCLRAICLCVYLLLLCLYDFFCYNKFMTLLHQSNASCGHFFQFLTSPTLVGIHR